MVAMTVGSRFRLPCEVLERAGRIPNENRLPLQTHEAPHPNRVLCRWQHRRKVIVPSRRMNYPRRQQYRRLSRAGGSAAGSAAFALAGLTIAGAGAGLLAGLLVLTAVGLGLNARRWLGLAGRSRIGARSEDSSARWHRCRRRALPLRTTASLGPTATVRKLVNVATDEAVIVVPSGVGTEEQTDLRGERAKAPLLPWKG